jgi:hypothetical protein
MTKIGIKQYMSSYIGIWIGVVMHNVEGGTLQ